MTKKELNAAFWRSQLSSFSFNYENMAALGFLYTIAPALKKIYQDKPAELKKKAMERHLTFFNGQNYLNGFIIGTIIAMEEKTSEEEKDSVISLKTGMMGPVAGLGDGLIKFTWFPICGSIGAALALDGNPLGVVLYLLLFNLLAMGLKYYGIHYSYHKGIDLLQSENAGQGIIQRISNAANVLGCMVIGGLICQTVKVQVGLEYTVGESVLSVQEMLDKVMPSLLTVLVVLGFYVFLRKSKGKHIPLLILGTLAAGILLSAVGILA